MSNEKNAFAALRAELKKEKMKNAELTAELKAFKDKLEDDELLWSEIKNNENIRVKFIADYLSSLSRRKGVDLIKGGRSTLTPISRPKNLQDAKRLADKIINS